jgi:glycosyltransferase involved in cell wall biosynthesis
VVTIHDITFDLLPRRYPPSRRLYMRAITRLGLLRAGRVIVPSAFVRDALAGRYGVAVERVRIVPEAAAPELARVADRARLDAVRARYGLPERVLLSLGTLEPGKNRETLFVALHELRRRGLPHMLAVAGGQGWLVEHAAALGDQAEHVRLLGYVPDADLAALYSLADVFLFPSWLEGFGLPPLEAMQCGTPVISSHRPAMPEVLGDAALYADPRDAFAWADAVERLTIDAALRDDLIARGHQRAARYSWARAARETLAVYVAALRGAAPSPGPFPYL